MAQLSFGSRRRSSAEEQFDADCDAQLQKLTREVHDVLFVAALETATGTVLHSINRAMQSEADEIPAAVCHLIRCQQLGQGASRSARPVLGTMITMRRQIHLLRMVQHERQLALYIAVRCGKGQLPLAGAALSQAARALSSRLEAI